MEEIVARKTSRPCAIHNSAAATANIAVEPIANVASADGGIARAFEGTTISSLYHVTTWDNSLPDGLSRWDAKLCRAAVRRIKETPRYSRAVRKTTEMRTAGPRTNGPAMRHREANPRMSATTVSVAANLGADSYPAVSRSRTKAQREPRDSAS